MGYNSDPLYRSMCAGPMKIAQAQRNAENFLRATVALFKITINTDTSSGAYQADEQKVMPNPTGS